MRASFLFPVSGRGILTRLCFLFCALQLISVDLGMGALFATPSLVPGSCIMLIPTHSGHIVAFDVAMGREVECCSDSHAVLTRLIKVCDVFSRPLSRCGASYRAMRKALQRRRHFSSVCFLCTRALAVQAARRSWRLNPRI